MVNSASGKGAGANGQPGCGRSASANVDTCKRSGASIMVRMIGLVRPLLGYMFLAVLFGTVGHLCATFLPVVAVYVGMKLVLGVECSLQIAAVTMIAMAILRGVFHYVEQTCNHFIAFTLLAQVRDKVFGALRRLAPAKLAGADKGDLISTLTSDIELLEVFYAHTISPICIAIITSVVMVAFAGSIHPLFALVSLAAYFVMGVLVPICISRTTGDSGLRTRQMAGSLSGFVLESLRGLREVLQYDAGEARTVELNDRSLELVSHQRRLNDRTAAGQAITSVLVIGFSVGQLLLGVHLFGRGVISADGVLLATVALFSSFGPTLALAALGTTLQGTLASGSRVLDILDEEPVVEENASGVSIDFDGASVCDVSFSYDGDVILDHVDIAVPRGDIVGISGKSGSGKSTLCRLLMRFWDVDSGSMRLSGADVRDIATSSLRKAEALVEQDTYLFHDSIADNLRIVKPDATRTELENACKAASIHDFIVSLPQGYDTPVGELGGTLSGGERQRLGLARAFLHDAPFLLLDEPTSNLDSLNEGVVLKSLDAVRGRKTVLLISHRASTMGVADKVFNMDSGRIS